MISVRSGWGGLLGWESSAIATFSVAVLVRCFSYQMRAASSPAFVCVFLDIVQRIYRLGLGGGLVVEF